MTIKAEKLATAYRYANTLPKKPARDYANAYIAWMQNGAMGEAPECGRRLSGDAASAVKHEIASFNLWTD